MIVVIIDSHTFGKVRINMRDQIVMPGDKLTIKPREGDVLNITLEPQDLFERERLKYFIKENQINFNDDNERSDTDNVKTH